MSLNEAAISDIERGKGETNRVFQALFRHTFSRRGRLGYRQGHLFDDRGSINAEEVDVEIEEHSGRMIRTPEFLAGNDFQNRKGTLRKDLWASKSKLMELSEVSDKDNFRKVTNTYLESIGVPIQDRKDYYKYFQLDSEKLFEILVERYEEEIKPLNEYEEQIFERLLSEDVAPSYSDNPIEAPKLLSEEDEELILFEEIKEDLRRIFRDYLEWEAKREVLDTIKDDLIRKLNQINAFTVESSETSDEKELHSEKVEFLKATFAAEELSKQPDTELQKLRYRNHLLSRLGVSKILHHSAESKDEQILNIFNRSAEEIETERSYFYRAKFFISRILPR